MTIDELERTTRATQVHLEEYKALRDEINTHIGHQNQLISYALAVITGTVALFSLGQPSLASQHPFLLLVASLFMSAISWAAVEASLQINDLGKYIQYTLTPKLQSLVGAQTAPEYDVLRWEQAKVHRSGRMYLKGITSIGKFAIAYVPSVLFIIAFYLAKSTSTEPWELSETSLYWASFLAAIVIPFGGLVNILFILRIQLRPFWARKRKKVSRGE